MNVVVVYNPKSGSALPASELRKKFDAAGIEIEKLFPINGDLERKLAPYLKKRSHIAAIGGDGTVSAVAGYVAGTKAIFIPLPGGTLNHFTKDLGVAQDIDEALQNLAKLKPRKIDIATVNGQSFINNSSLGIYPNSLRTREELEDNVGKWPAAIVATARALFRLKTYRITIDEHTLSTPFVFVGNNRYSLNELGGTERTKLDEGVLTVYVAKTRSRLTLLKIALFAFVGKADDLDEFDVFHPKRLNIETKQQKLSVSHDGEVSQMSSPLIYEIQPGKLTVLG